jgi:hypothetical protein
MSSDRFKPRRNSLVSDHECAEPRKTWHHISKKPSKKNDRANNSATKAAKKKGPLALASGPSLGRKRPRRAAIAQGATAPQQYATALHKVQGFLIPAAA